MYRLILLFILSFLSQGFVSNSKYNLQSQNNLVATVYGERTIHTRWFGQNRTTSHYDNSVAFTGRYHDKETGLYYFRARYYDSEQGRFISRDPAGYVDGMGLYNGYFASGFGLDPSGKWSPDAHDALIEHALKDNMSKEAIEVMQKASRDFDKETQTKEESYKHSMRTKDETIAESKEKTEEFVNQKIDKARDLIKEGRLKDGIKEFGKALHPLMDSTSPEHTTPKGDPKVWNPWSPWGHSPTEWIGNETRDDITKEIYKKTDKIINDALNQLYNPPKSPNKTTTKIKCP